MNVIAIDTETYPFAKGNMAPKIVCVSWSEGTNAGLIVNTSDAESFLKEKLKSDTIIVGHYIAYDMACALANWPDLNGLIWKAYDESRIECTRTRERLLDIAEGKLRGGYGQDGVWKVRDYTLDALAQRYLNRRLDKGDDGWRLRYGELDGKSLADWPKRAVEYAVDDAKICLDVFRKQEQRARDIKYDLPTRFDEARGSFALRLTSVWGIVVDHVRVAKLSQELNEEMASLRANLSAGGIMAAGGTKKKPKLRKDMTAIRREISFCWEGELPRTPKGSISTSKEVLEKCNSPLLQKLARFNTLEKQGSTYVDALLKARGGPIHASFDVLGAASSRTSCRAPNLQNQPRLPGVRECFTARPGSVLVACDFDSQEMRTLAQSCIDIVGSSKLAERYQKNIRYDPHQEFAEKFSFTRQTAKVGNFGLPGGMGPKGLAAYAKNYGIDLSESAAHDLKNAWFKQWPEMEGYFRYIRSVVGRGNVGHVVIPKSGFKRGLCGYTDAANTYFQSLAAHASKDSLYQACRAMYFDRNSWLFGSRPVNFVHDEILIESPEEIAHEAAQELEKIMANTMCTRWTPDVPASASASLQKFWSKNAKPVYDANGRLVPWEFAA